MMDCYIIFHISSIAFLYICNSYNPFSQDLAEKEYSYMH